MDWTLRMIDAVTPQFLPRSTLDYGCGVGLVAIPLRTAARIGHRRRSLAGHARGCAPGGRAARRSRSTSAHPRSSFARPRTFDFVHCYLLFQRIPQREGLALLVDLAGCLEPGGIGVFQFLHRTGAPRHIRASRWLRERIPWANAAANLVRGKPVDEPFIASHTYDLDSRLPRPPRRVGRPDARRLRPSQRAGKRDGLRARATRARPDERSTCARGVGSRGRRQRHDPSRGRHPCSRSDRANVDRRSQSDGGGVTSHRWPTGTITSPSRSANPRRHRRSSPALQRCCRACGSRAA